MLQLKADTESAAALIRGANERRAAEKLREEAEHEAEKEHLTTKGLNPYKASNPSAIIPTGTLRAPLFLPDTPRTRLSCCSKLRLQPPTQSTIRVFFLEEKQYDCSPYF